MYLAFTLASTVKIIRDETKQCLKTFRSQSLLAQAEKGGKVVARLTVIKNVTI